MNMKKRALKRVSRKQELQAGFSLIEIMIVVMIIGLLAAIAIPSFNKSKNEAIAKSFKLEVIHEGAAMNPIFYNSKTREAFEFDDEGAPTKALGTINSDISIADWKCLETAEKRKAHLMSDRGNC